jgi:hypothetical protein
MTEHADGLRSPVQSGHQVGARIVAVVQMSTLDGQKQSLVEVVDG